MSNDELPFHVPMTHAAKNRAAESERSGLTRDEGDGGWDTLLQALFNTKSGNRNTVVVIRRGDDQLDAVTFLHGDNAGVKRIFPGGHPDLNEIRLRRSLG